jgi:DNA-binding response OmpR family regulator
LRGRRCGSGRARDREGDAEPRPPRLDAAGKSGLTFAKELRGDTRTRLLPIIMVTARTDEADKVAGLEAGSTTT